MTTVFVRLCMFKDIQQEDIYLSNKLDRLICANSVPPTDSHNIVNPYRNIICRLLLGWCLNTRWCRSAIRCAWVASRAHDTTTETWLWSCEPAGWSWHFRTFGRARYDFGREVGNFDAFGFVVVGGWDDLGCVSGRCGSRDMGEKEWLGGLWEEGLNRPCGPSQGGRVSYLNDFVSRKR